MHLSAADARSHLDWQSLDHSELDFNVRPYKLGPTSGSFEFVYRCLGMINNWYIDVGICDKALAPLIL